MKQNFVEYVKSHIKEYLPMEYQNAVISVNERTKSNDRMLTGLTILLPGERAAPTIYLEALAEQVERGMPLDTAMKQIAQIQLENYNRVPLDISCWKTMRRSVLCWRYRCAIQKQIRNI